MSEIVTMGLDPAKWAFQVDRADGTSHRIRRKKLNRDHELS